VCSNGAASCTGTLRVARNPITGEQLNSTFIGKLVPGSGDPYNGMVVADGTPPQFEKNRFKPSPRAGFAWDIMGDGKMAVRGGWHQQTAGDVRSAAAEQPPLWRRSD
jgi:hypothetical protein